MSDVGAWVAWSALAEPGDPVAGWLVDTLGADGAWQWVRDTRDEPSRAVAALIGHVPRSQVDALVAMAPKWNARLPMADPEVLCERADAVGAVVVDRASPQWPASLADLGASQPFVVWVRGRGDVAKLWERSIAVVGSRSSSAYGEHVAATMAAELASGGWTVVSGGAYGIDAAAHRGAISAGGPTVAVLAGGVDRLYPAGNADLLGRVMESGVVMSEVPPGFAPHRQRFLSRNRMIATSRATVVVEAALRSGALSTARHACELARPVGAVPGPVTSPSSAGCHRMMREGQAVPVTTAREVVELAGPMSAASPHEEALEGIDFASSVQRQAYDALTSRGVTVDDVCRSVGLTPAEAAAALGAMEARGLVVSRGPRWYRAST